ncbi:IS110 family transposase [Thomasclavelia spiroformis]|uniref:IS110 family transposase n=1 Tax=Thomasclavelia spiroformis TaxID=29348 RepID=UPI00349E6EE3
MSANRVMKSVISWLERKLFLKVSATKTKVIRPVKGQFLGFTFYKDRQVWKCRPTCHFSFFERSFFMLKIHRFNCAGLDVHKNLIVATIGITDKKTRVTEYIQKDFSSLNYDLYNLKNWLIEHKCFDVCMESTGKYWIPVFNVLETEAKMNIVLVHPKYVKAIKGKKTDKKDSKWICDLFKHDLLKSLMLVYI